MLDILEVKEEKRLKCNGHTLLCIDNAIDKVFKDQETKAGRDKLISKSASHVFGSSSSIATLGLIAISKLLSPSHAQHPVSYHKEYTKFLKQKSDDGNIAAIEIKKSGFKGFNSNRFGRICELGDLVVRHLEMIHIFLKNWLIKTKTN